MKKLVNTLFGVAAATFLIVGCEKSDNGRNPGGEVSPQVLEAFSARYPGAQNVSWTVKGGYAVASFSWNDPQTSASTGVCSAWFDNLGGSWSMTETELPYSSLPQAVKTAFESSAYAAWRIDYEVDLLTRSGEVEPEIYVIEAEQAGSEVDLYYSPDGVLVKTMADAGPNYDYGDFIPSKPVSGVNEYIAAHYPGARIVDVDRESEGTEVEIRHEGREKSVLFNGAGAWVKTTCEVRRNELPAAVTQAVAASPYAAWKFDGADFVQSPDGEWYELELEQERPEREIRLRVAADGAVLA